MHCLLRHEITLHVLCRDKYSTSMQQFCHPGNNSYKQEPYSFQAYMHTKGDGPNQILNSAPLLLRFTILNGGGTLQSSYWIRRTLVASVWRPCPRPRPLTEHEGLSCCVTLNHNILNRRHRCRNTQERFGELFAAVPVLHIAKEALQFRYSTYRQFD